MIEVKGEKWGTEEKMEEGGKRVREYKGGRAWPRVRGTCYN
jgi:hypothetical protein